MRPRKLKGILQDIKTQDLEINLNKTPDFDDSAIDIENATARKDIQGIVEESRKTSDKYKINTTTHRNAMN
jgi:hypothetical protein